MIFGGVLLGLSGMDGSLFQAVPLKDPDGTEYGYVGDIIGVNEKIVLDALDADKVQITVGGKDRLDTFGKKMELYHFYERNDKLVVKEKE